MPSSGHVPSKHGRSCTKVRGCLRALLRTMSCFALGESFTAEGSPRMFCLEGSLSANPSMRVEHTDGWHNSLSRSLLVRLGDRILPRDGGLEPDSCRAADGQRRRSGEGRSIITIITIITVITVITFMIMSILLLLLLPTTPRARKARVRTCHLPGRSACEESPQRRRNSESNEWLLFAIMPAQLPTPMSVYIHIHTHTHTPMCNACSVTVCGVGDVCNACVV